MKRRDAIKALGALAGAATTAQYLTACGGDDGDGESGITTMVFLMMENRSYDHYLGARSLQGLAGGDGLVAGTSNPDLNGNSVEIFPHPNDTVIAQCVPDPPHGWGDSRTQMNAGANDGFVIAHQNRHGLGAVEPMAYMLREHLPVTWALADAYTTCDRWFASVLGPTLPNRMYWHAGTSNGATNNDMVVDGAFEGIDSLYHRLDAIGVDWGYYYSDVPVLAVPGTIDTEGRLHRFLYDFLDHAAAGTLPPVVYIDPGFASNDDHPPHHPMMGQQLISATYNALATSPQWNNCMLIVTYDEHGGFYDHVAPPTVPDDLAAQGFDQLGFRVPALAIGPYAKQSYISSVQYDHTSPIKHLQELHGFDPLTARVSAANNLMDCFDLERLAANDPAPPIQLPAAEIDENSLPMICRGGGFGPPPRDGKYDHDILRWADLNGTLGKYDLRSESRDYIYGIGEYLDHHNLGRIRRK